MVLLVDVRRALGALQDADDTLSRLQGRETGVVSIGMVSNAEYFLPRLLARFHEAHAGVELRVSVGNRDTLLRQLANNEVDLAVMGEPPRALDVRFEGLTSQPLGILASPEHRLAGSGSIPVAALAGHEFVVREPGSGTRAAMDRFFRESQIAPPRVMELTSNETIKQAVIANMGLGFLSLHTAKLEIQGRVLVVLDVIGLPMMRRWYVVHWGTEPITGAAESLRRFIVDWGRGMGERPFDTLNRESRGPSPAGIAAKLPAA